MTYLDEIDRLEKHFGAEYEGTYVSKDRKHFITVLHKWGEFKYLIYYDDTGEWEWMPQQKYFEFRKRLKDEDFEYYQLR